jgi:2-polyprenyl-3-methyl-5-hydroxy-6-metoxy-1,4-benzoquinol methylase
MANQRFFYETIADRFDQLYNPYDLQRRLSVIFNKLLPMEINGMRTLDLGCGSGWFSKKALENGANLTSVDISWRLACITQRRTHSPALNADAVCLPFPSDSFQLIISSEMIEHMANPDEGIREISRLLVPGGIVVLTTPNHHWLWLVKLGTNIKTRPYAGYENFLGFDELASLMEKHGLIVEKQFGFHPWPFQVKILQTLSSWIDQRYGTSLWGKYMINQAIRARKEQPSLPF